MGLNRQTGQANTHLNILDVVKENFLNDANVVELDNKTLVLPGEAAIDCNRV